MTKEEAERLALETMRGFVFTASAMTDNQGRAGWGHVHNFVPIVAKAIAAAADATAQVCIGMAEAAGQERLASEMRDYLAVPETVGEIEEAKEAAKALAAAEAMPDDS